MITIDLSEVAALVPHVQPGRREPVIVTHGGQAVAAVFPGSEEDVQNLLLSTNAKVQTILDVATTLRIEGRMSSMEVRRLLELPGQERRNQTNEHKFRLTSRRRLSQRSQSHQR